MIHFLATVDDCNTVIDRLAAAGAPLHGIVHPTTYAHVFGSGRVAPGVWVFTDLERLSPPEAARAVQLWNALASAGPDVALLNHPTRTLRRYALLRLLAEQARNDFDVYRLTEARRPRRFPVFLRRDRAAPCAEPVLLASPTELDAALRAVDDAGESRETTTITEFCDVRDADGRYRVHHAFVLAGRILSWRTLAGSAWCVREDGRDGQPPTASDANDEEPRLTTPADASRNDDLLRMLHEVAVLAHVDWGCIRYGMHDDRVQVWGIDTRPVLPPGAALTADAPWARALVAALRALDRDGGSRASIVTGVRPVGRGRTRARHLAAALYQRAKELRDRLPRR